MKLRTLTFLLLALQTAVSQGDIKMKGDVFMDYFFSKNHNPALSDIDGFQIRRVYLTLSKKYSSDISAKLRLEMNGEDFNNNPVKITPVVKDLSLAWKISDNTKLTAGIQGNSTVSRLEKFYGLRYVEKTPADLYKIESTRETGVSLNGKFSGNFNYHVLFGNGEGNKSENNKGDYFSSSLAYQTDGLLAEVNGHINTDVKRTNTVERTFNSVLGFKNDVFKTTLSFHYLETKVNNSDVLLNKVSVPSLFIQYNISEKSGIFARVDQLTGGMLKTADYYNMALNEDFSLMMFGYTCSPAKGITLAPSITQIKYDNGALDSDLIGKLTLRFKL